MLHRLARVDCTQQPCRHGAHAIPDLSFRIAVAACGGARLRRCWRRCGRCRRGGGLGCLCRRRCWCRCWCRRFHGSRFLHGHGHGHPCRRGSGGRGCRRLGNQSCCRLFRGHDVGNRHRICGRCGFRQCDRHSRPDRGSNAFARYGLAQWRRCHDGRRGDWPGRQQRWRCRDRSCGQQRLGDIYIHFIFLFDGLLDRRPGGRRLPVKTTCRLQFIHGDAEPLHLDANPDNGGDFLDVGGIRRRHGK